MAQYAARAQECLLPWLAGMVSLTPLAATASNGLNLIGFGAESVLMAGADAAVARDTSALNTNPAGLGQFGSGRWDVFGGAARALDVGHADRYGNDLSVSNKLATIAGGGYAARWNDRVVLGAGFYMQGGAGAEYKRLHTSFGTDDELTSLFGIAKLAAGAAWQPAEGWRLGMTLSAVIAQSKQRLFPNTSVADDHDPARSFFGSRVDGARTARPGLRLGLQVEAAPTLTLALVWSPRVALPLRHGHMSVNFSAIGLGEVRYGRLKIDGLALPQEWSLGAAWRPAPGTELSVKLSHLGWSRALSTLSTEASEPDNPAAPPVLRSQQTVKAHDRVLVTLGVHQRLSPDLALLAGVNLMRRVLDDNSLSPTFAPIGQRHLTFGFEHRQAGGDRWLCGLEWLLADRVRYTNPQVPFGADAQARNHYLALHLMYSRPW